MATATVADWVRVLDDLYPPSWAEDWDAAGLQVGDRDRQAGRILVALDPTEETVREAGASGCGLLVTHHPLLLRPLARLDLGDPQARVVAMALSSEVAIFSCHTNADVASPGVSDALASALGIEVAGPLRGTAAGSRVKLVTFVPAEATRKVLDAVAGAGGGVIGEYTHCSFRVHGTGSFLPSAAADPVVGERGSLNEVEEDRLEIVVPVERRAAAVEALVDAHPYEEVAYDVYPLSGGGLGLGRVGRLPEATTAGDLAALCDRRLGSRARLVGDPGRPVSSVALCGGSGASLIPDARRSGVDAYVTGDVKHHDALEALAAGLPIIDAGHHATELPFVGALAEVLRERSPGGEVLVSEIDTDPFRTF